MPEISVLSEEGKIVERTVVVALLEVISAVLNLMDRRRGECVNRPINRLVSAGPCGWPFAQSVERCAEAAA